MLSNQQPPVTVGTQLTRRAFTLGVAGLATALATAGALAGCSQSSSSGGDTITYWSSNQGKSLDSDKQFLTTVLDDFTKQTGLKVNLEVIGWANLQNRIQTAITSGQGPDVINIGNTWSTSLQATGAFLPFDDAALKAVGGKEKFVTQAFAVGGKPGQPVTSLPLYGLAYAVYYNKKMFADAGVQAPTTWEDFVATAKKLTKGGVYGFGVAGSSYFVNSHFAFMFSAQNGGNWFDSSDKPSFTTSENVKGVKRYLDLMQTDKVVNPSDAQYDDPSKLAADFAAGKIAMMAGPTMDAAIVQNGMKSTDYGAFALPAPAAAAAQISTFPVGANVSILKNTKNKDSALKLVKYLTGKDVQIKLANQFGSLAVLNGVAPTFTDNTESLKVQQTVYETRSKPMPLVASEDQFESTVGKAMIAMFTKIATGSTLTESDIRAGLQQAQSQVTQTAG